MSRTSTALVSGIAVAAGLLVVQAGGAHALGAYGLSEHLFAGDATSVLAALVTLSVVVSRALLAFVLPGYVTAVALAWLWARRSRGDELRRGA